MEGETSFRVTLQDFSGPLDLLCHLVESRSIDASSVRLTDVLSQYVSYLLSSKSATLAELAEFFSLASRLLIRKVRSLLPSANEPESEEGAPSEIDSETQMDEMDEETLAAMLERFKPYRAAAMRLEELKAARERMFVRISDEGGPPWFDIGDLYGLSTLWWRLIGARSRASDAGSRDGFLMEIPDATPEEVLVERRMDDVCEFLSQAGATTLSALLAHFGAGGLIVTLLALLELSRLGRLGVSQSCEWGDVEIGAG
ncbi:MAG: segregation/condensation protein A [Synergistaceae bacterium]|jgi:segregation and condensation protein A|nr:segregation/condensation protein A [Synergistaceae bacterium]